MDGFQLSDLTAFKSGSIDFVPVDFGMGVDDAMFKILNTFAQYPDRIKFLPALDFSTKESTMRAFHATSIRTDMELGFAYLAKLQNLPAAVIFVDTPEFNGKAMGKPIWTLEFFILEPFRGQGYMSTILVHFLYFLQKAIGVGSITALVDQENTACLSLMSKLPFDEKPSCGYSSKAGGLPPRVFECPLDEISFR